MDHVSTTTDSSSATHELWRPVPDWPTYEVSNLGRVRNASTLRPLTLQVFERDPYPAVVLKQKPRKPVRFRVHVLVLLAFAGHKPSPESQARHLDGNRKNNRIDNLTWGTPVENCADRTGHGRLRGAVLSRLTELDVLHMRTMRRAGKSVAAIARLLGINERTAGNAITGVTWAHLPGACVPSSDRPAWYPSALKMREQGMSYERIAAAVGVSTCTARSHLMR